MFSTDRRKVMDDLIKKEGGVESLRISLWGDASKGHWDPRLNQIQVEGSPLLRPTGETSACRSAWGDDGIYDMVGNLDEWVDDPATKGTFVGGFYARDTVRGCDAKVTEHPAVFFDFSTGVRCCSDLKP